MKIRKANADDIASMMSLARASVTAARWTEQQYRELLSPAAKVHRLAIVAEAAPEVLNPSAPQKGLLGFLVARFLTPECELENIVVSPAARRTGIGKRLLDALLQAARETNNAAVFLEVRESNHEARAFYEHVGFKLDGRRKSYYFNPSEDAILYRLAVD
ncbi:MAG: ribosomal protein S18-alanine N-acetyltransferase [Candidatus Sulfotelmatobacter sp.]